MPAICPPSAPQPCRVAGQCTSKNCMRQCLLMAGTTRPWQPGQHSFGDQSLIDSNQDNKHLNSGHFSAKKWFLTRLSWQQQVATNNPFFKSNQPLVHGLTAFLAL